MSTVSARWYTWLSTMVILACPLAAQHNLIIQTLGFDAHVGKNIFIYVTKATLEIADVKYTIQSSQQTFTLLCLEDTTFYTVNIFVDANSNGMYDGSSTDPSWKSTVDTYVAGDKLIELQLTSEMSAITYPVSQPPSVLTTTSAGSWNNRTFKTTGPAEAQFELNALAQTSSGSITFRGGAFGQPNPVTMAGSGTYNAGQRNSTLTMAAPFSGALNFDYGKIEGTITYAVLGVSVAISGTYGADQMMFSYTMSGVFSANGYVVLHTTASTSVNDQATVARTSTHTTPFPASSHATVDVNPASGLVRAVHVVDAAGNIMELPWFATDRSVGVQVRELPCGLFSIVIIQDKTTIMLPLLIAH